MKTDAQIQQDILNQLQWNPLLMASDIGVSVKYGIVTLSGHVSTHAKKREAEKEAKGVAGVKAIAEEMHVGISPGNRKTDAELAQAVLHALLRNASVPEERIFVKVEGGIVTLEGDLEWCSQREAAMQAVASLAGIRNVISKVRIRPNAARFDLKQRIKAAFRRHALPDAGLIQIELQGGKVTLKGRVRTTAEKEEAERAVWSSPGIVFVENRLKVEEAPDSPFWEESSQAHPML